MNYPKRSDVWLVSLDPIIGNEIGKTRPAVIISNDLNNRYSGTITVLPVTSNTKEIYPFETFLKKTDANIPEDSKVKCNQIRTISKERLIKYVGRISPDIIKNIEYSILIHLGIILS